MKEEGEKVLGGGPVGVIAVWEGLGAQHLGEVRMAAMLQRALCCDVLTSWGVGQGQDGRRAHVGGG